MYNEYEYGDFRDMDIKVKALRHTRDLEVRQLAKDRARTGVLRHLLDTKVDTKVFEPIPPACRVRDLGGALSSVWCCCGGQSRRTGTM